MRDLRLLSKAYADHLSIRHFSSSTIHTRSVHLQIFVRWCNEQRLSNVDGLSPEVLVQYQSHLMNSRSPNGAPRLVSTQHSYLLSIRSWICWMSKQGLVSPEIGLVIPFPKLSYRLPRVLSAADIEQVFERCPLNTRSGIRDRALLETLYSSGIRRMELLNLKVHDLDWHKELVAIRMGKGRKDRIVPIGERALAWIDRYLWEVRPSFARPDDPIVFLTRSGRAITPNHLVV